MGGQWLLTAKVLAEVAHGQVVQETMTYSAAVSACMERPMAASGVALAKMMHGRVERETTTCNAEATACKTKK